MDTPTPCSIIPPWMLDELARNGDDQLSRRAERTRRHDELLRRRRDQSLQPAAPAGQESPPPAVDDGSGPLRRIHDAQHGTDLPGLLVRGEHDAATGDVAADEAYEGLGHTWRLFHDVFARDSIDAEGMALVGSVHYSTDYDNAFWDGEQMVFGDGDGRVFSRFTASLDVIGHELAHGVTQHSAALVYEDEAGALNESVSDVFGSLVRQYALGQDVAQADWLIGAELLAPGVKGRGLRDMLNPGTAYDDPELGTDPQPAHMDDFVHTQDDNGGVHINSGIPNRAFALAARAIGGRAWEGAGQVWYDVLTGDRIQARCGFATFARLTVDAAAERFGADSAQLRAVADAWRQVGVTPAAAKESRVRAAVPAPPGEAQPPAGPGGSAGSRVSVGGGDTSPPPGPPDVARGGEQPDASTPVLVQRSGGFAGTVKQRETTLGELPEPDARHWANLIHGPTLRGLADAHLASRATDDQYRDGFSYRVCCEPAGLDVTLGERVLPRSVRELFRRTLEA